MMTDIDFSLRIRPERPFHGSPTTSATDAYDIAREFESDRGRILNSAAIRRLQQKTQVFPLERNASVRSRLTHSLEVQQVGRYIAKEVLNRLKKQGKLATFGLENYEGAFESLVEMGCLMHDIGNPPFGHFGEAAINDWFSQRLLKETVPLAQHFTGLGINDKQLKENMTRDLCHFDGNAQGIRIIYTLQKLNLTYAQTACILKYTRPAYFSEKEISSAHSYLMKKPGYYLTEKEFVEDLWRALNMSPHSRHPLIYIMEAADDISYCIADLEDAVEKSILTVEQLYDHLYTAWQTKCGEHKADDLFERIVTASIGAARESQQSHRRTKNDEFFMKLRVKTINALVDYVATRFIEHLPEIFAGHFNHSILEARQDGSRRECEEQSLLAIYKEVAFKQVFRHEEVELLELQGYRILTGLLDCYEPLLLVPFEDFTQLVEQDKHKAHPIATRLYHKLSPKHRQAYRQAVNTLQDRPAELRPLWEFYYRCRLVQDYISGMTDDYAKDEYQKLNAISL